MSTAPSHGKGARRVLLAPTSWKAREFLRPLFEARGWIVDEDSGKLDVEDLDADLLWCSGRDIPWKRVLEGEVRANAYYLKTALNRKADMHRMCTKFARKGSRLCSIHPRDSHPRPW